MSKLSVFFTDNTSIDIVGDVETNINERLPELLCVDMDKRRLLINMRYVKYTESEEDE